MTADRCLPLAHYLAGLPDPRLDRTKKHLLGDVIIGLCVAIAGAEPWEDVERFGERKSSG